MRNATQIIRYNVLVPDNEAIFFESWYCLIVSTVGCKRQTVTISMITRSIEITSIVAVSPAGGRATTQTSKKFQAA